MAVPFLMIAVGCRGNSENGASAEARVPATSPAALVSASASAVGDPFEGCSLMAAEQEGSGFKCGSAIVIFGEMDDPFDPAAAERNFLRFEEGFPPKFRRQRSVETLRGQHCPAVTVSGDDGMWTRFLVVPVGSAKTRVLSCGDTAGSGRCLPVLEALAVHGLPDRFRTREGGAPLDSRATTP